MYLQWHSIVGLPICRWQSAPMWLALQRNCPPRFNGVCARNSDVRGTEHESAKVRFGGRKRRKAPFKPLAKASGSLDASRNGYAK